MRKQLLKIIRSIMGISLIASPLVPIVKTSNNKKVSDTDFRISFSNNDTNISIINQKLYTNSVSFANLGEGNSFDKNGIVLDIIPYYADEEFDPLFTIRGNNVEYNFNNIFEFTWTDFENANGTNMEFTIKRTNVQLSSSKRTYKIKVSYQPDGTNESSPWYNVSSTITYNWTPQILTEYSRNFITYNNESLNVRMIKAVNIGFTDNPIELISVLDQEDSPLPTSDYTISPYVEQSSSASGTTTVLGFNFKYNQYFTTNTTFKINFRINFTGDLDDGFIDTYQFNWTITTNPSINFVTEGDLNTSGIEPANFTVNTNYIPAVEAGLRVQLFKDSEDVSDQFEIQKEVNDREINVSMTPKHYFREDMTFKLLVSYSNVLMPLTKTWTIQAQPITCGLSTNDSGEYLPLDHLSLNCQEEDGNSSTIRLTVNNITTINPNNLFLVILDTTNQTCFRMRADNQIDAPYSPEADNFKTITQFGSAEGNHIDLTIGFNEISHDISSLNRYNFYLTYTQDVEGDERNGTYETSRTPLAITRNASIEALAAPSNLIYINDQYNNPDHNAQFTNSLNIWNYATNNERVNANSLSIESIKVTNADASINKTLTNDEYSYQANVVSFNGFFNQIQVNLTTKYDFKAMEATSLTINYQYLLDQGKTITATKVMALTYDDNNPNSITISNSQDHNDELSTSIEAGIYNDNTALEGLGTFSLKTNPGNKNYTSAKWKVDYELDSDLQSGLTFINVNPNDHKTVFLAIASGTTINLGQKIKANISVSYTDDTGAIKTSNSIDVTIKPTFAAPMGISFEQTQAINTQMGIDHSNDPEFKIGHINIDNVNFININSLSVTSSLPWLKLNLKPNLDLYASFDKATTYGDNTSYTITLFNDGVEISNSGDTFSYTATYQQPIHTDAKINLTKNTSPVARPGKNGEYTIATFGFNNYAYVDHSLYSVELKNSQLANQFSLKLIANDNSFDVILVAKDNKETLTKTEFNFDIKYQDQIILSSQKGTFFFSRQNDNTPIIIGATVGGIALVVILALGIFFWKKQNHKNKK